MAKEYFRTLSAVFPIILRREGGRTQILLHLRQNTGYMDGFWDVAGSGHVDGGETASQALCRASRSWASASARRTQSSRV